jgi:hypothetical protein
MERISASIPLLGNYSLASFNLGADSGGGIGTVVTHPPATNDGLSQVVMFASLD